MTAQQSPTEWFTKVRRAQSPTDFETWQQGGVSPTLNSFDMGDVRSVVLIVETDFGKNEARQTGGKGVLLSEDRSLTFATGNDQTLFEGSTVVRRLTPTECERLQGFPDGWTANQSDSARYKQMGNAVTVNVVQWVGQAIMAAEHATNQT